jgi:hypothetical protein
MAELPVDVLTFNERVGDPGATASSGKYHTKDVGGVTRWFYQDSAGVVSQLAAGLVPPTNSVEYRHLVNKLVKGPHTTSQTTALQSVFAPGNDSISLDANTTYKVKGVYALENASGTSTLSIGFSGGTIQVGSPGDAFLTLVATVHLNPTANTVLASERAIVYIDGASANLWPMIGGVGTVYKVIKFEGLLRTVSAGTFIPQIQYASAVSGTPLVMLTSYLELIPVGDSTFQSVGQGGWA